MTDTGEQIRLLSRHDLPNVPGFSLVMLLVTYAPGGHTPPHTHGAAFCAVHVLSGAIQSQVRGEELKTISAGESFCENPGEVHLLGRNVSGTEEASFIAVFIAPSSQKEFVM